MRTDHEVKLLLIADDMSEIAEMIAELLVDSRPGVTADVASDGAEALAIAIHHPPAVGLLDIDMPVMTGIEAACAIRAALPTTHHLLLLAMTGDPRHANDPRAKRAYDHVLIKPLNLE